MKRLFLRRNHLKPVVHFSVILTALALAGCAGRFRWPMQLAEGEQREVSRRFEAFLLGASRCQDLEADTLLTFRSWFVNGAIPGILQARRPASLKFVGINPLGQPLAVFTVDGVSFQYMEIAEKTAWEGKVTAAAFREKTPLGVEPGTFFSWLTGWPGKTQGKPAGVERDSKGGYWLEFRGEKDALGERYLYDPQKEVLLARQVVDVEGTKLLEARYAGHQEGECSPPSRVSIGPLTGGGSLEIAFKNSAVNTGVSADEFQIFIPTAFERVHLE